MNGSPPIQFTDAINAGNSALSNRAFLQFVGGLYQQRSHTDIHSIATKGIQGLGRPLTHLNAIQQAFGHHNVSAMREHTGPEAKTSLERLGAKGFSINGHMAFAGRPDLYTQAHEAAHGVQQAGLGDGLQLKGGIGETGDQYEQQADAVAEKVVRGESAESLLDQVAGRSTEVSAGPVSVDAPVQMMLEEDKLDYLVKLILCKRELPKYWPMIAHRLYGAELDEADVAYITARVPFAQRPPEPLAPKEKETNITTTNIQETASEQQETSTAVYPVKRTLSDEGYKQLVDWILENDIRALFFGDSHSVPDTMLPVEVVRMLADRGMLHGVMIESAYGLLSQQARDEYGTNIAGFNGAWVSNDWQFGGGYMKDQVVYRAKQISERVTRQDQFYKKVLFPNIKYMSDTGELFENTRRFKSRIY